MNLVPRNVATREVPIEVTLKSDKEEITKFVRLTIKDGIKLVPASKTEQIFRRSIDQANGLEKMVLTDLYIKLVRGNFTKFNGRGGDRGEQQMLALYRYQDSLPSWKHLSGAHNGTGAIFKNLLDSVGRQSEVDLVLGGVLYALIQAGAFGHKCQVPYDNTTLKRILELDKVSAGTKTFLPPVELYSASDIQVTSTTFQVENDFRLPEEVPQNAEIYLEGGVTQVSVNKYERDPMARKKCIEHYGIRCVICNFDFESTYGAVGHNLIHVHHLQPLSTKQKVSQVDPIKDLRPVCPNCHAIIHRRNPIFSIEEVSSFITSSGVLQRPF